MCEKLDVCKTNSKLTLNVLTEKFSKALKIADISRKFLNEICVYACGSLAREELANKSDLDLFFIYSGDITKIRQIDIYRFFSVLSDVSKECGFDEPSKGGAYWKFISLKNLIDIGSQEEDFNNSLTARLLLILESKPILNPKLYNKIVDKTLEAYFKDLKEHLDDFVPMYLMNDIRRYWYTLTLNYEFRRDNKDSPEEKNWKRLKLKFARKLTCFSFIACLIHSEQPSKEKVLEFINKTAIERFEYISENNSTVTNDVKQLLRSYSKFIALKDQDESWWNDANKKLALDMADEFHGILKGLMIKLSEQNTRLNPKLDF